MGGGLGRSPHLQIEGAGRGRTPPPHLQTECPHGGVGGGAAPPPICKQNARMMGFKKPHIN